MYCNYYKSCISEKHQAADNTIRGNDARFYWWVMSHNEVRYRWSYQVSNPLCLLVHLVLLTPISDPHNFLTLCFRYSTCNYFTLQRVRHVPAADSIYGGVPR